MGGSFPGYAVPLVAVVHVVMPAYLGYLAIDAERPEGAPTSGTSWLRRTAWPHRSRHVPFHISDDDPRLYLIRRAAKRSAVERDYVESRFKILKNTWRMWIAALKMQRAARTVGDLRYIRLAALQFKRHALAALRRDLMAARLTEQLTIQGYVSRDDPPWALDSPVSLG